MSSVQARRHRRHANPFALRGPVEVPDWERVFARQAPLALDIGCGSGLFVQALAQARPDYNVVGLEIRHHLVEQTRQRIAACRLTNAHAVFANANLHVQDLFAPRSIAFVSLNFPDPWYKKRHHKRRVIQAAFLQEMLPLLCDEAYIHAMTDYAPLAEHIRQTLEACTALRCVHAPHLFAPQSTTGLPSEREITHLQRGQPIYRLQYFYELGKTEGRRVNIGAQRARCYTSNRAPC